MAQQKTNNVEQDIEHELRLRTSSANEVANKLIHCTMAAERADASAMYLSSILSQLATEFDALAAATPAMAANLQLNATNIRAAIRYAGDVRNTGRDFLWKDAATSHRIFTHQAAPAFATPPALETWFEEGSEAKGNKHVVDWLLNEDDTLDLVLKDHEA